MLFYVLFCLIFAPVVGLIIGLIVSVIEYIEHRRVTEDAVFTPLIMTLVGLVVAMFPAVFVFGVWTAHASDISKVESQHHRIEVFEERIDSLNDRLSEFNYPEKSPISVDSDTPWASMVKSLTDAETQLAHAKDERAVAIRSIRARMRGPLSGVVNVVGLPVEMQE